MFARRREFDLAPHRTVALRTEAKTIAIETGVQNGALALAIAGLLITNGPVFNAFAIPAALYGVVWLGAALPVFLLLARRVR